MLVKQNFQGSISCTHILRRYISSGLADRDMYSTYLAYFGFELVGTRCTYAYGYIVLRVSSVSAKKTARVLHRASKRRSGKVKYSVLSRCRSTRLYWQKPSERGSRVLFTPN
ncbi:unnamed protein product [Clonostachys rosea]|uniref:Uncharacterized protein n=1 Tax=Bionectria ochroleuca TaxID=29856 RepID=A0ABY6V431_BIOOC|nr:unnamed protein product [Clonostachys rosea]